MLRSRVLRDARIRRVGGARSSSAVSPPGGGAPGAGTAPPRSQCLRSGAATSWEPPLRVHTSPHTLGNGPREPRCPPGVAGLGRKPESRPLLAWDSLPLPQPRPALPGLGVISVPSREPEARSWRWQLAPLAPSSVPQEAGSCSPRRCPSLFEYPDEGGRLPEQGAPGAPWGVTPGKAIGAFRARENFVLPPGHGKC